jgi:hypothetical protein
MTDVTPTPDSTPTEVEVAQSDKPARNGVGIAGLVLVILSFVAPIAIIIVGLVLSNNYSTSNSTGTGGLVVGAIIAVVAAGIVAIVLDAFGIILGIVSLFRTGKSKVVGVVAIVLGLIPAAASFGIFSFFGNAFTGN